MPSLQACRKQKAGQGRSGTLVPGGWSLTLSLTLLLLWCLLSTMWSCGTVPFARAWVHGHSVHHLVWSPSLFPTLLSDTLLAWLATWAQVRPTLVPSSLPHTSALISSSGPARWGPSLRLRYPSSFLPTKDRRCSILELQSSP